MGKNIDTRRISICGVMIAVYFVLAMFLTVQVGGYKFTFEHFPVVLCSVMYGPLYGAGVGVVGELLNQLLTFGLTPTTALWILPIAFRGLAIGLCSILFKRHMRPSAIILKKIPLFFGVVCVLSGVVASLLNTLALYVDSKMFGYFNYVTVIGALGARLISSVVVSILIVATVKPVLHALRRARFI